MPRESADRSQTRAAETSGSQQQLDEICHRFELSWQELRPPRINNVISEVAADLQRPLLLRLVPLDIDGRWRYARTAETVDRSADESQPNDALPLRPRLEDYVRCFSAWLRLDDLPSELIAHEYRVRHRWGDRPDHAEYVSRFSSQADSILPSLAAVDAELGQHPNAGARRGAGDTLPLEQVPVRGARQFPDVPGYEILDVLGRGGMGVVYRARQTRLNRIVALKMILSGQLATPQDISRFRSEAEAAAKLDHVGIVPIFEVGGDGENHYFSMAYVEGKCLADRLARGPLSPREAAAIVERIATAVEYAHRHGIIHRDLKPRNILLTADGQPKITDFGLAKDLDADQGQTATGQILGTPGYMSPEQARGKTSSIGPRSDVYSLGAILYCLLTARPPFQADGVIETLRQVVECEPVSPRLLNPAVSRDLETICLRCLAKNPDHRLASAQDLADELDRVLRGEPIRSRRIGPVGRAWRWVLRKPLAAALCAAVVVLCGALWAAGHLATRVSRSQELTRLLGQFEQQLDRLPLTEEALADLDALAVRIEELSPARADQARSRLNQSFARLIEQTLREPKLDTDEFSAIEAAVSLLQRRDATRADELGTALVERRSQWQTVFDLQPPFVNGPEVFGPGVTIDGQKKSLLLLSAAEEMQKLPVRRMITGIACEGDVQIEATFEAWQTANEIGLALNATDQGGYSFVLRLSPRAAIDDAEAPTDLPQSFAAARTAGGLVIEEIRRNNLALVRRSRAASDLAEGPLRLSARRQRDELLLQVNALPPLRFFDPFMLASGSGAFGVRWPEGTALRVLRAQSRSQPLRPSALEGADRAFDQGHVSDALALYRAQLVAGADEQRGHEARYKSALCLAALKRDDEAAEIFESLLAENGDRWPPLAGCQLWLIRLRQNRDVDAEAVFENLSGRFSVEQLAALTPADARETILQAYSSEFNSLGNVLRFTPKRVEHVERALAIDRFLNGETGGNAGLAMDLARAYESRGDLDRALDLAAPIAQKNPWDFNIQRRYLRMLCLVGKGREALDAVDRRSADAPAEAVGFKQAMLLQRCRVNAALGDFENAESDIDALLAQPLTQDWQREYLLSFAYLLQGLLRDRRGAAAGAREAWRLGYAKLKDLRDHGQVAPATWLCWQIQGALSGDLSQDDVSQAVEHAFSVLGSSPLRSLAEQFIDRQAYVNVFQHTWRTPRGRALAHDFAFDRLTTSQRYQLPLEVAGAELVRQMLFGGDASAEQEDLVDQTVRGYFLALVERGTLGKAQIAQLGLAWKGISGGLGWAGAAPTLEPDLRARSAYLLAHRYLRLDRHADAEKLFGDCVAAAPGSAAATLAKADLELLSAARGAVAIESEAPYPVDLVVAPADGEAELLHVDRHVETVLRPGRYRLLLAEPKADVAVSPDEIDIDSPSRRTLRIAWRWQPAESGESLPGLAPGPSRLAGMGRWQIDTRQPRGATAAARSPDGRQVAVGSIDGRVRLYTSEKMELTGLLAGHELAVSCLAYQPSGELLATGSKDGTVRLWRMPGGQLVRVLRGHAGDVTCLAWSHDGRLLASGGDWPDRTVRLWLSSGEHRTTADVGAAVRSVTVHPSGDWFATANYSHDVRLWRADGTAGPTLVAHSANVDAVAFSPDGRWLASGGADATVRFWNAASWQPAAQIATGGEAVSVVAWSRDGASLAIGTWSGNLSIHPDRGATPLWQRKATGPIFTIDWNTDNTELATYTGWGWTESWRVADGEAGSLPTWLAPQPTTVALSNDGRRFAVADYKTIAMGNVGDQSGQVIDFPGAGWLAFDARGERLASLSRAGGLKVWNVAAGEPVWSCPKDAEIQRLAAFAADGTQVAAVGDDRIVRIWSVTGEAAAELPTQHDAVLSMTFSPDGKQLAIGLGDKQKQVQLWALGPLKAGPVLSGHTGGIEAITFSRDGQRLATASHDNSIRLWDVDGRPGRVFDAKSGWLSSVAWSADGQWLASFGYDSRCRIWQADGTRGPVLERSLAPWSLLAFDDKTGNLLVLGKDSTIRTYRHTDGQWLRTTLLLSSGRSAVIGPGGQIQSASLQADDDLLYIVETPGRGFRLLSPAEFQQAVPRSESQAESLELAQ